MQQDILLPFDLPAVARKKVCIAFDGGMLSSSILQISLREFHRLKSGCVNALRTTPASPVKLTYELTAEILKSLLTYDPGSGVFSWRVRAGPRAVGSVAGSRSDDGYWVIGIGGKVYKAHRLAHLYMTGEWPVGQIDHHNIDHGDNRWENLRPANTSNNKANNPGYRGRKHDLPKGVYRTQGSKRRPFVAQIRVRGESIYLGSFPTAEQAHAAYSVAAHHHFGELRRGRLRR